MEKYDTVGIDCVAMNVNDVICVGAEPISFVDYLAIQKPDIRLLSEIAKGLAEGAKMAKVTIIGGEIAQLPEIIKGKREGFGFDLAGMCLGIIELNKIVDGRNLEEGDVIIGLESSGIHSNGLTLARKVLLDKAKLSLFKPLKELDKSLGEELLTPTKIYVQEVLEMLKKGVKIKAMAHITGKGLLNLRRVGKGFGYQISFLPEPQPIFKIIQKYGEIPNQEMYEVFNMGIGFCIIASKEESDEILQIAERHRVKGYVLGNIVKDPERKVALKPKRLISYGNRFLTL
jgi:phosphoribosylformylglycinamidine cyclo-ligase